MEYEGATWQQIYDLNAALPYGTRILIPLLSRPLVALGLSVDQSYFVWELASSFALFLVLSKLFGLYLAPKISLVLSLTFFLILSMAYLIESVWPLFYPYDTPAIVLTALGLYWVLVQRWGLLFATVIVSALNRESAILLPMIFAALAVTSLSQRRFWVTLGALVTCYAATRGFTYLLTVDNPVPHGSVLAWRVTDGDITLWRFQNNLGWLLSSGGRNIFIFLSSLSFLPIVLYATRRYRCPEASRLLLICGFYLANLFFVGNLFEPRIFGESLLLMYFVTGLSLHDFLKGDADITPMTSSTRIGDSGFLTTLAGLVDRWGWLLIISQVMIIGGCLITSDLLSGW